MCLDVAPRGMPWVRSHDSHTGAERSVSASARCTRYAVGSFFTVHAPARLGAVAAFAGAQATSWVRSTESPFAARRESQPYLGLPEPRPVASFCRRNASRNERSRRGQLRCHPKISCGPPHPRGMHQASRRVPWASENACPWHPIAVRRGETGFAKQGSGPSKARPMALLPMRSAPRKRIRAQGAARTTAPDPAILPRPPRRQL